MMNLTRNFLQKVIDELFSFSRNSDELLLVVKFVLERKLHVAKVYPKFSAPDREESDCIRLNV